MGKAPHPVRAAARLAEVAGLLATHYPGHRTGDQLGPRTRVAISPAVQAKRKQTETETNRTKGLCHHQNPTRPISPTICQM